MQGMRKDKKISYLGEPVRKENYLVASASPSLFPCEA